VEGAMGKGRPSTAFLISQTLIITHIHDMTTWQPCTTASLFTTSDKFITNTKHETLEIPAI